jgi:hypothetical protein
MAAQGKQNLRVHAHYAASMLSFRAGIDLCLCDPAVALALIGIVMLR